MPFTPTHVLAIAPLAKFSRWLPFSALAIGSMIPDLPLFFPISSYAQTHSPTGLITVCLPMGLITFLVFQAILKVPLIALLPTWIQQRIAGVSQPRLKISISFFLSITIATLLGAMTHIVWDAFTHDGRWGTELLPFLQETLTVAGRSISGYKLFQYGSTMIGLPLLVILSIHYLRQTSPSSVPQIPQLTTATKTFIISIITVIPIGVSLVTFLSHATIQQKLGTAITTSGALLILALIIYSLTFPRLYTGPKN